MIRSISSAFLLIATAFALAGCGPVAAERVGEADAQGDSKAHILQDRVLGDPAAPLTLIEYGSWTCGACGNFHMRIMPVVKSDYIETGKVKLIFREFPTGPVNLSIAGFILARCAGPDKYYDFIDELFARQSAFLTLARNGGQVVAALKQVAGNHGIDGDGAYDACLDAPENMDAIKASVAAAKAEDVYVTPTFILNGEKLEQNAHVSQKAFTAVLDKALAAIEASE